VSLVLSILLVLVGASIFIVSQFFASPSQEPVIVYDTLMPYDETEKIDLTEMTREKIVSVFAEERSQAVPSGQIKYLKLVESGAAVEQDATISRFLALVEAKAPAEFVRSLDGTFMAGIYGDGQASDPFLLIKLSSFDNAYSGMLTWESTLWNDLGPLMSADRAAPVVKDTGFAVTGTTTAFVTAPSQSDFDDLIVNNLNTRVVRNDAGQIIFLYSFIDNDTLLITTNDLAFQGITSKYTASKLIR
ncbi:MAG TPA: hypothetical protein VHF05_00425, partial [Candidatus Paceibacterota bacterium]|nr:hypothetical protein [Candidatus Paceibacterota bacterium]